MGYDYNVTDAEFLKGKLCNCQTESNNVHNSSISIMSSIYDKLHKNTIKKYPDNYQLNIEPDKWIDMIDSILNNFKTKMEQLSEEDTIQGATFNDSVSALDTAGNATATGTESGVIGGTTEELIASGSYDVTGESSTVVGDETIEDLNTSASVAGNGQASTVTGEESIEILEETNSGSGSAQASTVGRPNVYTVNTESGNLNVRDASGSVITSIPKDSTVKVIGEADGNGYVEVEYGDGKTGYVYQDYLKETPNQELPLENSNTYTVNTESSNLNVRDASGNVITSIPKDSTVKVIGEADGNGYVEVEYGDGKTGYVYQDYLKETPNQELPLENSNTYTVNTESSNLNVRDASGNVITSIPKDSTVKVIGEADGNGYVEVEYDNGKTGYVYQDYLKETPATQAQTTFESFEGVVDTQNTGLNIRTSPTSENNSNIIGSLEKGSNINIVGEEGDWYKIALDDGSEAYVSKQFITRR